MKAFEFERVLFVLDKYALSWTVFASFNNEENLRRYCGHEKCLCIRIRFIVKQIGETKGVYPEMRSSIDSKTIFKPIELVRGNK